MYQLIFKRKIREGFRDISEGNFDKLLRQFAPEVDFSFSGDHAMAGEFRRRETVKAWFERVHKIFPGFQIQAREIFVSGLPWNVVITTRFAVWDTLPDGSRYENDGVQVARIRWGRVVEDHLYEDSQRLADVLQRLGKMGNEEAVAAALRENKAA